MSPFATLNLFHNCFGYLTTPSLSTTQKCHKIIKIWLVAIGKILSEHVKGLRLNAGRSRDGFACLLYGNLAFTSSGLALKFCGKILKTTTPKNFTVLKH